MGWRGVFQPLLEKRFSFLAAALIEGVIWGVWHLPLWFIPNSTQGDMNFIAFTLYCTTLGMTLAAAYRLTKCIWVTILIHAWSNTVLGGMYTLTSLNNSPSVKTLVVYALQIAAIMLILLIEKKRRKCLLR
ncbi:CPBP family intramembrane metalloprotease [Murimonas intestini]|nr:CPBP family intramembrane metalloprotease [Murimonas intestini]MCR1864212.1 CPBP family intramembrane metalloprotease [Murimonas intestini]MCR1881822.1 CPBP family intramembrane metalloprotease [Murimonas intestini]